MIRKTEKKANCGPYPDKVFYSSQADRQNLDRGQSSVCLGIRCTDQRVSTVYKLMYYHRLLTTWDSLSSRSSALGALLVVDNTGKWSLVHSRLCFHWQSGSYGARWEWRGRSSRSSEEKLGGGNIEEMILCIGAEWQREESSCDYGLLWESLM